MSESLSESSNDLKLIVSSVSKAFQWSLSLSDRSLSSAINKSYGRTQQQRTLTLIQFQLQQSQHYKKKQRFFLSAVNLGIHFCISLFGFSFQKSFIISSFAIWNEQPSKHFLHLKFAFWLCFKYNNKDLKDLENLKKMPWKNYVKKINP